MLPPVVAWASALWRQVAIAIQYAIHVGFNTDDVGCVVYVCPQLETVKIREMFWVPNSRGVVH